MLNKKIQEGLVVADKGTGAGHQASTVSVQTTGEG